MANKQLYLATLYINTAQNEMCNHIWMIFLIKAKFVGSRQG